MLAARDFDCGAPGDLLEGPKLQNFGARDASHLKHKCLYAQPGQCVPLLNLKQYRLGIILSGDWWSLLSHHLSTHPK